MFAVVVGGVENDNNDTRDNEYFVYPSTDPGPSQPRTRQSPTSALSTRCQYKYNVLEERGTFFREGSDE